MSFDESGDPRLLSASTSALDARLRSLAAHMAPPAERTVLRQMFRMLRSMPHQWNINPEIRKKVDKTLKKKEMMVLTNVYRQFDQHATVCTVRRKLSALISLYITERQGVALKQSLYRSTIRHKPRLWYYKDLSFMDSSIAMPIMTKDKPNTASELPSQIGIQEKFNMDHSGPSNIATKNLNKDPLINNQVYNPMVTSNSCLKQSAINNVIKTKALTKVYLKKKVDVVYNPLKNVEGRNDDIEAALSCETNVIENTKLNEEDVNNSEQILHSKNEDVMTNVRKENFEEKQLIFAQKLIEETLRLARLGKLTENSVIQM